MRIFHNKMFFLVIITLCISISFANNKTISDDAKSLIAKINSKTDSPVDSIQFNTSDSNIKVESIQLRNGQIIEGLELENILTNFSDGAMTDPPGP